MKKAVLTAVLVAIWGCSGSQPATEGSTGAEQQPQTATPSTGTSQQQTTVTGAEPTSRDELIERFQQVADSARRLRDEENR